MKSNIGMQILIQKAQELILDLADQRVSKVVR